MKQGFIAALVALALLPAPAPADGRADGHHAMDHAAPGEPGQAAFAAIAEIVALLEADPATDWAKVDIEALRRHLVDMDEVTMNARAVMAPVPDGARFTVTGEGRTRDAVRRMIRAHAATMDGTGGWRFVAEDIADGAVLTATAPDPAEAAKLRGLGFIGVMTRGMHHQTHHLMIAAGRAPHE